MDKIKIDESLAFCAKINFENLEKDVPSLKLHPFYIIAKAQLDEALGEKDAIDRAFRDAEERRLNTKPFFDTKTEKQ